MHTVTHPHVRSRNQLSVLVHELKHAWRTGVAPSVAAAFRDHPDLLTQRTLVVDLAYEAYCLHEAAGQIPPTEAFLDDVPAFRSHVREVIFGHRELADHPEAFDFATPVWPSENDHLEDFKILCELGRGAFARAYLCQDANTGNRPVVLKLAPSPSFEGHALGAVDHPDIVRVLWARKLGNFHAICMPYVGNATLAEVVSAAGTSLSCRSQVILDTIERNTILVPNSSAVETRPLFSARDSYSNGIARIGVRLAESLAYLHSMGIVHGDLKPTNIILDRSAKPFLIDFNMAQRQEECILRFGGTLPYMAPEALDPSQPTCSPKASEVYSLGVVLYECLTGTVPHEPAGENLRAVAADQFARKNAGCPAIRLRDRRVPRRLARVLDSCLSPDPTLRPTAAELARKLRSATAPRRISQKAVFALLLVLISSSVASQLPVFAPTTPVDSLDTKKVRPPSNDEIFARGVAAARDRDWGGARLEFNNLRRATSDPQYDAYFAYCLTKAGQHRDAEPFYVSAIDGGFEPAWVHNNRAYSLLHYRVNDPKHVQKAVNSSQKALELNRTSTATRLNFVVASFQHGVALKRTEFNDPKCLAMLMEVLSKGPLDADVCYKGAMILAASGSGHEELSVCWLRKAIEHGRRPASIRKDPAFRTYLQESVLEELSNLPAAPKPSPALNLQVIDPFG